MTGALTLRRARQAQLLTLLWMVVEGAVAIGAGVGARSPALLGFGLDSLLELATAAIVLRRLVERSEEESGDDLAPAERRASRAVGVGLYLLCAYLLLSGGAALLLRARPEASGIGVAITAASVVVMAVLWRWRLSLAERLASPALRADASCSLACLYMGVTTLVGLLLNVLLGWWWADPVAAVALVWWLRGEATEAVEAAREGRYCED